MSLKTRFFASAFLLLTALPLFSANTWYIATNGLDSNPGTMSQPFATIPRAQTAASSGDTVFIRGGTYLVSGNGVTTNETTSPWALVFDLTKSGISYIAYPNDPRPTFDFTAVQPIGWRVTAFFVSASDCVFKGFDVVGVPINITASHTQSECFRIVNGNRNRFEQLVMHDGHGIGWYLTDGQSNLVLNCDAYNNTGINGNSIGNIDGFGCHPAHTSGTGNILSGCRAWFNSDDGFDCLGAFAVVKFTNCWALYNGWYTNFVSTGGDANGIKAGGYGDALAKTPTVVPHHIVEFCLTVSNRANGFYANHHLDGQVWYNNTAYRNGVNYNMLCNIGNTNTGDVLGFDHVMKNNLGFGAKSAEVSNLGNAITNDISYNYFTLSGLTVNAKDFQSLDVTRLTAPRQADGSLPYLAFGQLVGSSNLVDAGTNINLPYLGMAPDLGAFEYGTHPLSDATMVQTSTNLIFTGSGGPQAGTNYLIATSDFSLPIEQWTRVQTNSIDLAGNYSATNTVMLGNEQLYYRFALP